MKTVYTLAREVSVTHGHGNHARPLMIGPMEAYDEGPLPPVFESESRCEHYRMTLDWPERYKVIALHVIESESKDSRVCRTPECQNIIGEYCPNCQRLLES